MPRRPKSNRPVPPGTVTESMDFALDEVVKIRNNPFSYGKDNKPGGKAPGSRRREHWDGGSMGGETKDGAGEEIV